MLPLEPFHSAAALAIGQAGVKSILRSLLSAAGPCLEMTLSEHAWACFRVAWGFQSSGENTHAARLGAVWRTLL